jgi:hypothetical protein
MITYSKTTWPFDAESAKTIECYVTKAPRAKLYIWRSNEELYWNYTMNAGADGERSHTGYLPEPLSVRDAVTHAIEACKKHNSWTL